MSTTISAIGDAVTQSATKLGFELKEKQREAVLGFCQGRDVFVSLPTGYGKSIIYAVLPMVFNILNGKIYQDLCVLCYCIVILDVTNSILVCISPLTAIMQEQSQRFCKAGIKSGFVGELQKDQAVQQKVLNGHLDVVYTSP